MSPHSTPRAGRSFPLLASRRRVKLRIHAASLLATAAALVPVLTGCSPGPAAAAGSTYTLMQMNLCLSGLATCYAKVAYPGVLNEAVARINETHPNAVTFNEACRNDVAQIARRTGYHLRFARVIYGGKPLPCIDPTGRGLFGNGVLTKSAVRSAEAHDFKAQAGPERRRWLCVTTRAGVEVCTSHLASNEPIEVAANKPQCSELKALLARRAAGHPLIFGGDMNRVSSCAPGGFWTRSDATAGQDPGLQQVYGTQAFRSPSAAVVRAAHSDHDILLIRARLAP